MLTDATRPPKEPFNKDCSYPAARIDGIRKKIQLFFNYSKSVLFGEKTGRKGRKEKSAFVHCPNFLWMSIIRISLSRLSTGRGKKPFLPTLIQMKLPFRLIFGRNRDNSNKSCALLVVVACTGVSDVLFLDDNKVDKL